MKKITIFLIIILVTCVYAFADDIDVSTVKKAVIEGTSVPASVLETKFADPAWKSEDDAVVFTGTVKPDSVFNPVEKEEFFDMLYTQIEEAMFGGMAEEMYSTYIVKMSPAEIKRADFDSKRLLNSEKYYNIMEILDEKAAGSKVKIVLKKIGDEAVILSYAAPNFYVHNASKKRLIGFLTGADSE